MDGVLDHWSEFEHFWMRLFKMWTIKILMGSVEDFSILGNKLCSTGMTIRVITSIPNVHYVGILFNSYEFCISHQSHTISYLLRHPAGVVDMKFRHEAAILSID